MRLFLGVPLSAATRADLEAVVAATTPKLEGWRWTSPESWHITLQFLGNVDPTVCTQLIARLRPIQSPAVPIQLGGLDFFDRIGAFFVDVALSPELIALQQKVVRATALCGFVAETRPYHPHITLARVKSAHQDKRGSIKDKHDSHSLRSKIPSPPRFPRFEAAQFLLYESFLGPGGSRYEVRKRFALT